jgi:protein gp37
MGKVNKSKIEWCDYTWSPVTGCLHNCDYCYAKRQTNRFKGQLYSNKVYAIEHCDLKLYESTGYGFYENHSIDKPVRNLEGRIVPYPFGFKPTFHRYRLDEPQKVKKPSKIFVVSMGDLFGGWVPQSWIEQVFKACEAVPQHTYMFLTKNPKRYKELQFRIPLPTSSKYWYGTTVTSMSDIDNITALTSVFGLHTFLSIEPLLGPIDLSRWLKETCTNCGGIGRTPNHPHILAKICHRCGGTGKVYYPRIDWIIIGSQTGPGAKPPKPEWVQSIIDQCREAGVPVFLKNNLNWPEKIQEFPEGM